ncbi:Transcription initiation factor TFIID subunit 10 [Serendipita sp. 411]|nr:Transcription initiation factor TFIID subunit 10 [Serendipita sp. 398]KAG8823178.1 Transcription initiation factor TFIID subunit 10 [Serendipita sp. 401]KAG8831105.1 Transcription initiation factor TFIID subunit 10 [Serendipita sp. 400]KAG8843068.1 Transcription initiation factor TFIID subunit 10 [Serendipita sp. 411]KAG9055829.1 Transcription initiation factor TFIID subunit 10 [Serendipita sp. 407]
MSASDAAPESSKVATDANARKDRTLAEFLLMLDDFKPLVGNTQSSLPRNIIDSPFQIPSEVTDYYLQRVGFDCEDERLKRLLALAAQKFVSDIAADAYSHARIRSGGARNKAGGAAAKIKTVLTMDDLTAALGEYGVNAKKPEYYL